MNRTRHEPEVPTAGEHPNYWHADYECAHCGAAVTIPVTSPWPTQCWSCLTWNPRLVRALR